MKTTSRFAAITCSRTSFEPASCAARRESLVRRGRTTTIAPAESSPTQSPTTGRSTGEASLRRRPVIRARTSPSAVRTSYAPRCWIAIRPGTSPSSWNGANTELHASSQPSVVSSGTRTLSRNNTMRRRRCKGGGGPWRAAPNARYFTVGTVTSIQTLRWSEVGKPPTSPHATGSKTPVSLESGSDRTGQKMPLSTS